jgi:hypothetical protein
VEALKQERQRLREEGCAIMLQSAWRTKKARRKAAEMKARKQRLMEEGAALQLQAAWRIKQARKRVSGLKQERAENKGAVSVQRLWKTRQARRHFLQLRQASTVVERVARGMLTRQRLGAMMRSFHPHNIIVSLKHGNDLNVADTNTSDPYVLVTAHSGSALLSYNKSKTIANTLNPVWNQDVVATLPQEDSRLALTIMDSDVVGHDDFMGQVPPLTTACLSVCLFTIHCISICIVDCGRCLWI